MALYQCDKCGAVDNTALGWFWSRNRPNLTRPEDLGKKLCSVCAPTTFPDGTPTGKGKWHNRFKREFLPKGQYEFCYDVGALVHIETRERPTPDDYSETEIKEILDE